MPKEPEKVALPAESPLVGERMALPAESTPNPPPARKKAACLEEPDLLVLVSCLRVDPLAFVSCLGLKLLELVSFLDFHTLASAACKGPLGVQLLASSDCLRLGVHPLAFAASYGELRPLRREAYVGDSSGAVSPGRPAGLLPLTLCQSCESGLNTQRPPATCSPRHSEPLFFSTRLDSATACDFPCCLSFSPSQRPPDPAIQVSVS